MNYSITYVITTNKNIRCYGCNQNCDKFQAEKYVDLNSFKEHMQILKNIVIPSELHFSGGEPLLHKELKELCQIASLTFPQTKIYIHTNGILLNTLKDEQLLELTQKYNVIFSLFLYPIISYLKTYQKQVERFEKLNINMYWNHQGNYFNKFTLNKYSNSCCNTVKNKNQLLISDGKIYPLCPAIQKIQFHLNNNYIELNNLTNIYQIQKLFDIIDCSNCKGQSIPLSNIYVNNYKQYECLIDYVYDLGAFLQIPFFYKNIKESTSDREFEAILNKTLTGWMDIYIPYSKTTLQFDKVLELKKLLTQQKDINKFNLYFVAIDDDIETQQYWFEIFESSNDFKLNTYFLKGQSLYLGEKKFFDNSRIINHYILDASNLDILKDTTFLSNIANNKRRIK